MLENNSEKRFSSEQCFTNIQSIKNELKLHNEELNPEKLDPFTIHPTISTQVSRLVLDPSERLFDN